MTDTLTLIEKTVCMKSSEVFAPIPTEALAQLAARSIEMHFDRGETVFREGEDDQGLFIVVSGLVEVRQSDVVVRVLRDGTVQGELFRQESESHQSTGVAREDSCVLHLGRADVFDALLEYPEFGIAMVQDLALRHHQLMARVIELEQRLGESPAALDSRTGEGLEPPAAAPALPKRRGWWRLAARPGTPPPSKTSESS